MTPYEKRPVTFLHIWEIDTWRMKVYTISYNNKEISEELITAAKQAAQKLLTEDKNPDNYNVGFIGIHQGLNGNFVFVDWWINENELHHNVLMSSTESPGQLVLSQPNGPIACVWDLYLIGFERDAWVEHVLKNYQKPDFDAYLSKILNTEV